jgi:hypothetical protein
MIVSQDGLLAFALLFVGGRLRRHQRLCDVVQIIECSFDTLKSRIAFSIVIGNLSVGDIRVRLHNKPNRVRLSLRISNCGSKSVAGELLFAQAEAFITTLKITAPKGEVRCR